MTLQRNHLTTGINMTIPCKFPLAVALIAAGLSGCVLPPVLQAAGYGGEGRKPAEFWWGTSTASFQNEDRGVKPGSPYYFKPDWRYFARGRPHSSAR